MKLYDPKGQELYALVTTQARANRKQRYMGVAKSGDQVASFKREIIRDNKYLGHLEMEVTVEGIKTDTQNLAWRSLLLNFISTLVLVAVIWWLTVRLHRGLGNLHRLASNINSKKLPDIDLTKLEPDIAHIAVTLLQLQSELQIEARKRKKAEEIKNDFFAMTVHDLKQPVTGLQGAFDLLLPDEERSRLDKDTITELCRVAQSSIVRLNAMISDLLNVAKLSSPAYPIHLEPVVLGIFLKQSAEQNSISVIDAGKKWAVSIPSEMKDYKININCELVQRAIGNLVLNAIQYTPKDGQITLGARFLEGRSKVELYVSDEGSGIPEEFRKAMFTKYSSISTNPANVGLGLAFCAMVAERHSAVIKVKSAPEIGTEIGFVFSV